MSELVSPGRVLRSVLIDRRAARGLPIDGRSWDALPAEDQDDLNAAAEAVLADARKFADTWYELLVTMPDDYGCTMQCGEADAAAALFRSLGLEREAATIIARHVAHHTDEDEPHQLEATPVEHAHTVDGPSDCRRCQLLRDNQDWMDPA